MTDIYGIPNRTAGLSVYGVHGILKKLRAWHDELPEEIHVKERGTARGTASILLAYNQCIIQTTRPVLLHLFKTHFYLGADAKRQGSDFSPITLALADSCVSAAQISSRIAEGLFLDGSIATFGYWDAQHIFSSALILVMSAVMKPSTATSDALETLLSILRSMKNDGNIPAVDFCERLSCVQSGVASLRARGQIQEPVFGTSPSGTRLIGEGTFNPNSEHRQEVSVNMGMQNSHESVFGSESVDILGNPLIDNFLDQNQGSWADALFAEDGTLKQFASEIEEQFGFFA